MKALKSLAGSPITLIAGVLLAGTGGVHFYVTAVKPTMRRFLKRG